MNCQDFVDFSAWRDQAFHILQFSLRVMSCCIVEIRDNLALWRLKCRRNALRFVLYHDLSILEVLEAEVLLVI